MANDMQFFLILPILAFLYIRKPLLGYVTTGVLLFAHIVTVFVISQVRKVGVSMISSADLMTLLYMKPWARIGPYLVGVLAGFAYYEWKTAKTGIFSWVERHQWAHWIMLLIGLFLTTFLVFAPVEEYRAGFT